jgi:hypothetical protein
VGYLLSPAARADFINKLLLRDTSKVAQSLCLSNSAACMLENGYMFLKYVLLQGLGELAAGNDSRNEPQSNALLRTTLRYLAFPPNEIVSFSLERKVKTDRDENKYFSRAPIHTDDHLQLLTEIEQAFTS